MDEMVRQVEIRAAAMKEQEVEHDRIMQIYQAQQDSLAAADRDRDCLESEKAQLSAQLQKLEKDRSRLDQIIKVKCLPRVFESCVSPAKWSPDSCSFLHSPSPAPQWVQDTSLQVQHLLWENQQLSGAHGSGATPPATASAAGGPQDAGESHVARFSRQKAECRVPILKTTQ